MLKYDKILSMYYFMQVFFLKKVYNDLMTLMTVRILRHINIEGMFEVNLGCHFFSEIKWL